MWIVILLLILIAVGGLPHWGYSRDWGAGYYPSGLVLLVVVVLLFLALRGRL